MNELLNLLLQVLNFVGTKVMTITIGGISLLGWITSIVLVVIIISFIYNNSKGFVAKPKKRKEKSEDE